MTVNRACSYLCPYLLLLIILLMLHCQAPHAQQFSVISFTKLDNDLDARVSYPQKDRDGELAALIKVVTSETGFEFDGGMLGVVKLERRTGEYWLYVPRGAAAITIMHDDLGVIRDYVYPIPVEIATVYEMILARDQHEIEVMSEFLLILTEPKDALIYLDDIYEGRGMLQKKLLPGRYTYRVEAPLYHSESGIISIQAGSKEEKKVVLSPNHGYIKVLSLPETGANVLIDDIDAGFTTNGISGKQVSGEHVITLIKDQYQPLSQKVNVTDGDTTIMEMTLTPNFVVVDVTSKPGAYLYLNSEFVGRGAWNGRLTPGIYTIEARLMGHKPSRTTLQVRPGNNQSISLHPTPIYGAIEVTSTPPQAVVTLNNDIKGTTPLLIRDLLVGEYKLNLRLPDYMDYQENIVIEEGPPLAVHGILSRDLQPQILLRSDTLMQPETNQLGVSDHENVSNVDLPLSAIVLSKEGESIGNKEVHNIGILVEMQVENDTSQALKNWSIISNFEMVYVEGGSFSMGCIPLREHVCEDAEKPGHLVSLSSYYIGKYEVTQQQWVAVMDHNPSHFSGCDLCPVENVGWNDIQDFLRKLNQMTGKNYRLPTEAEWEFAAQGGNHGNRQRFSGGDNLSLVGWFVENSAHVTHIVGSKQPNALGLYDMSGNVWEWCSDWYGAYDSRAQVNPRGPANGACRVKRGGSWNDLLPFCSVSYRGFSPDYKRNDLGFRLVLHP